MYPILIRWDSFILPSWHFFYVLGAIAAYFIFLGGLSKGKSAASRHVGAQLFSICYIAGYFGARALSIAIEEPNNFSAANFVPALATFGAMTFYGGTIAGFLFGLAYVIHRKLKFGEVFDAAIPALLVALGIGRIGCFLNGDDYGAAVSHVSTIAPWWSVTFPNLADGLPRYPVQLWEAGFALILGLGLFFGFVRIRTYLRPAGVGVLGVLGYALFRFWNEYYRGDDRKWLIDGQISTSQGISALIVLILIATVPAWLRSPTTHNQPLAY